MITDRSLVRRTSCMGAAASCGMIPIKVMRKMLMCVGNMKTPEQWLLLLSLLLAFSSISIYFSFYMCFIRDYLKFIFSCDIYVGLGC